MNSRCEPANTAATEVARDHDYCFACGRENASSMGLCFERRDDGTVTGSFPCDERYCGYEGRLHGGVITTLLDAAMTHCLFSQGIRGYTARLNVRFRHPVRVGAGAQITARIRHASPPLYVLEATLSQGGQLKAVAEGVFSGQSTES